MNDIFGNTDGLKPSEIQKLQRIYRRRVPMAQVVTPELAGFLAEASGEIGRQVGVLIDRRGQIDKVVVGDAHKLELPDLGRLRSGRQRFRGIRLVHTHLADEPLTRDDLTDLALLRLDLVAARGGFWLCSQRDDWKPASPTAWPRVAVARPIELRTQLKVP